MPVFHIIILLNVMLFDYSTFTVNKKPETFYVKKWHQIIKAGLKSMAQ